MRPLIIGSLCAAILAVLASSIGHAQEARPAAAVTAATADALTTTPTGRGLPVVVRAALQVVDIAAVDEQNGTFTGTVDVRLRWEDPRLAFLAADAPGGVVDLRGDQAEQRRGQIWSPDVELANLVDKPSFQARRLRLLPEGRVELMQRTTGRFTTSFDAEKFPFERQELAVDLVERREPMHRLTLDFRQDDVEFSRAAEGVSVAGWRPGLVHLRRAPMPGWYGEAQARLRAGLEITRDSGIKTIAVIFLPLVAAILIPLLALWLQRVEDGKVVIETYELTNILIGGLFALIALNFTISSAFPTLMEGDNTVTRLLGLNYVCLAVSLVINMVLFRFNLVGRLFGKHVLTQVFNYLTWALPVLVVSTAAAIILLAMA